MIHKQEKKYKKKIISFVKKNKGAQTTRDIKKALKVTNKNYRYFEGALEYLRQTGQLTMDKEQRWNAPHKSRVISGELRISKSGYETGL